MEVEIVVQKMQEMGSDFFIINFQKNSFENGVSEMEKFK